MSKESKTKAELEEIALTEFGREVVVEANRLEKPGSFTVDPRRPTDPDRPYDPIYKELESILNQRYQLVEV